MLPRTHVAWIARLACSARTAHPWAAEAALGIPEGTPGERPANVVALDDVEGDYGGMAKRLGARRRRQAERAQPHRAAAERGRRPAALPLRRRGGLRRPRRRGHARALGPAEAGRAAADRAAGDACASRRGHVVSRPAGTRISHCLRAGDAGLTYLAYGTRDPNDVCYYPRSNKIFWRGLGLIARLEPLDYFDGEPS